VSPTIFLVVFGLVFVAELPDKTALAGLMLGARYPTGPVFAGMAAAFAGHVALAVAAGSLLRLLPHRVLEGVVAALFALGAVLLLRGREEETVALADRQMSSTGVALASFAVIGVAEFGDLTQILTANLAARYDDVAAVATGSVLALWAVGGLAVWGGSRVSRRMSLDALIRVGAAVMLVLAVYSLVKAVRG